MTSGYSPKRWRQGTDVMLLKAPEIFLLKKLRTIVLYEADYNHENKRIGRDAMRLALKQGQIVKEQYSSPGRSAQDNALNKRLVFDHFRFQKQPFGMCACDLKSCYDRIVHSAASLSLQRIGISLPRIQCMFSTVQRLVHRVRTAYGSSEGTFGGDTHDFQNNPQGTGQGNGAAPAIWSILSSTIFQLLHKDGHSTEFCTALSKGLLKICGFSYVDDCDLITAGPEVAQVADDLQKVLTAWDRYMQVTGAAIAPDKCWWYLVDFKWVRGKWKYHDAGKDFTLTARDKNSTIHPLENLPPNQSKQMVGVTLAPDGNQDGQKEALLDKANQWAAYVKSARLDHETTWTALKTTIIKSIEYPLTATSLTKGDCITIMDPILKAALPRSNIVNNFARAILYGPVQYQGMGLHDPYVTQGIRHVKDIVDQQWKTSVSGDLITGAIEAAQLEAGLYGPLFMQDSHIEWFNTSNAWIVDTLNFCYQHKIKIHSTGTHIQPACEGDQALMQTFQELGLSKSQLLTLNRCRISTQVVSLSEVVSGDGKTLYPRKHDQESKNKYSWPNQGKILQEDWRLWDTTLKRTFCGGGDRLTHSLRLWTIEDEEYYSGWSWYLGADGDLYRHAADGWEHYPKDQTGRSRRHRYVISTQGPIHTGRPPELFRTTIKSIGLFVTHTGIRERRTTQSQELPSCLRDAILSDPETSWTADDLKLPQLLDGFVADLYAGLVTGVSDGSYEPSEAISSAAWILYTSDGSEMEGACMIPGTVMDHNSYRGELGGILAQLLTLKKIEETYPGTDGYDVIVACDGESALFKSLTTPRSKFTSSDRVFDILSRIADIRQQLKARILPVHVEGHVDDTGRALSEIEIMNCRMDSQAKRIMHKFLSHRYPRPQLLPTSPNGLSPVSIAGVEINSELMKNLRFHIGKTRLLKWWLAKKRITYQNSAEIHWSVTHGVMSEASFKMKKFMSKWVAGQFGVGTVMEYRRSRQDNSCPRCFEHVEDPLHVLQCPHPAAQIEWDKLVENLQVWMRKADTHPSIRAGISQVLWHYRSNEETRETFLPPDMDEEVNQCFHRQSTLGWTQFLHGFLSTAWAETQHRYYKAKGSRKTGRRWAVNLSKQLWWIVFGMWDHRNQEMFSGKVDILCGEALLKQAISRELTRGLGRLSPLYHSYFQTTTRAMFKKATKVMKQWLVVIRKGRLLQGTQYDDEIERSLEVQVWIGLIKAEEANRQRRLQG